MKHMNKETLMLWIKAALIRAVKTIAQSALALIPVAVSINDVDWIAVLGTSFLAGVISLLMSIAGLPEVKTNDSENSE